MPAAGAVSSERCSRRPAYPARHLSMEAIYEYGSRVGVWRIPREFERRGLPLTGSASAMALERASRAHAGLRRAGPRDRLPRLALDPLPEHRRRHRARAPAHRHEDHQRLTGSARGLVHRPRQPNTRRLVADCGGFAYDSDYYGDDLPFWTRCACTDGVTGAAPVVPYTLDTNDMRFAAAGLQPRRPVLRVPARQLRRALRRGRRRRRRC